MKRYANQDIFGMARVGYVDSYEIYVNTNDGGEIPHFHMRDPNDWSKFHTCVLITKAEYFLHEGKEDVLNSKQRKALQKFMESPVANKKYSSKFANNWELVCFLWELNNSDVIIPDGAVMPDYRKLTI